MRLFLKRLERCGVIDVACLVVCIQGLFFAFKKDGRLRMIVDARVSNTFFKRPPSGETGSASSLGELQIPEGEILHLSQHDVKDFSTDFRCQNG